MKKDNKKLQEKLLDYLRETANISVACNKVGISRQTFYRWKEENPEFAIRVTEACEEGDENMNDYTESRMNSLIKNGHWQAIRYRLDKKHPKYMKDVPETFDDGRFDADQTIRELGLQPKDFADENLEETTKLITNHLLQK